MLLGINLCKGGSTELHSCNESIFFHSMHKSYTVSLSIEQKIKASCNRSDSVLIVPGKHTC